MEIELIHFEMTEVLNQITVKQGLIQFNDFEKLKRQAEKLADQIEIVEVNEENLKISKKLIAAVNKRLKELEDRRIAIKKTMLEPYQVFEDQVKEIVGIVKNADETVREQINYLEQFERLQKEELIKDIFEKRIKHYSFKNLFGFKDFLNPKHLNKTTTIKAVEDEMIEFLEKLTRDLAVIETMPNAESLLSVYIEKKDLAVAMTLINQQEQRRKRIEASQALKKNPSSKAYTIFIEGEKDFKLVEMFMLQNQIKYTIKDVI